MTHSGVEITALNCHNYRKLLNGHKQAVT